MKLRFWMGAVLLVCLFATLALAADPTGKWIAQMPGRDGSTREVTFQLKASGSQLTGTMITARGEREISEGTVNGDEISFVTAGGQSKTTYKGKVSDNEIRFTIQREGREPRQVTAKKATT